MPSTRDRVIRVVAAVIRQSDGRWLLVRKRGTDIFMQPGGKIDPGESALDALVRELAEELGMPVDPADLVYLGRFQAPAANEEGFTVDASVYAAPVTGPVTPLAEIEELRWVDPGRPGDLALAPLLRLVMPAVPDMPPTHNQDSAARAGQAGGTGSTGSRPTVGAESGNAAL